MHSTKTPLGPAVDSHGSSGGYYLSDVSLDISSPDTAVFRAKLHGPAGSKVWVRAWLSTEIDGTLAEVASEALNAGERAELTLKFNDSRVPDNAFMRIESAPLATEHVVMIRLAKASVSPPLGAGEQPAS